MIPEELMQKVRELELHMRRSVSEVFSGEYSSAFRGQGMEFSEVREYQPGDEIRSIDWNVTARTGVPHIKRFVEERELTVMLTVDLSASGRFGSVERIRAETAAELCAVLAFAAVRNQDKVGLLLFADDVEHFIPPKKGMKHVLRLARDLLECEPPRRRGRARAPTGTNMLGALEHLGAVLKRRSVIFLVSDFLLDDADLHETNGKVLPKEIERALAWLGRKHDIIAARMEDPRERELPSAGLIELEDEETGARIVVDTTSPGVRRQFDLLTARRSELLSRQLRKVGADEVRIVTGEPYIHALIELFRRRETRR